MSASELDSSASLTPMPGDPWQLKPNRDIEAESILAALYANRAEEIADELVLQLMGIMPRTDELGAQFRQDVMDTARVTLSRALKMLGSQESLDVLGPMIEDVARKRRRQQIPQEIIFAGYRYLQHLLFERVTEEIRDHTLALRLIDALALRQLEFQWVVARRVAIGYDVTMDALAASREESVQAILEMLVGHREDASGLSEQMSKYGLLLPLDHIAVTIPAGQGRSSVAVPDDPAIRTVARANPWSVVGGLHGRVIVISRGAPWDMPSPWGGCSLTQDMVDRPDLLAERLALAGQAAEVANRLGLGQADADDVAPFIAVSGMPEERQAAFLQACFGDLHTTTRGAPILRAVATYARSNNRKEAAQRLKVHPNTLDYRLARFRELTHINLADPVQRLRCDLGLFLLGMLGSE